MTGPSGNRLSISPRDSGSPPQEFLLTEAQPRSIEFCKYVVVFIFQSKNGQNLLTSWFFLAPPPKSLFNFSNYEQTNEYKSVQVLSYKRKSKDMQPGLC